MTRASSPQLIAGQSVLLSPGVRFPLHGYPSKQVMMVLEGSLSFSLGERSFEVKAGDVCMVHGGPAREKDMKGIDIFVPPKEDYLKHTVR